MHLSFVPKYLYMTAVFHNCFIAFLFITDKTNEVDKFPPLVIIWVKRHFEVKKLYEVYLNS